MNSVTIDNKSFAIGILSLTAVVLLVANLQTPQQAHADLYVRGRDYQAITARVAQGGDGLYIVNREGLMAVFTYDPAAKTIKPRAVKKVEEAFFSGGAVPPPRGGRGAAGG